VALRSGIGYDVHRTATGRPLILGGVRFESDWGLDGHSDADVLMHAVGDALLGAMSLGDLGEHFPPSDPRWKDVAGAELLERIRAMLEAHGGRIVHVDSMLVAEAPRVADRRDAMRTNIAAALRIPLETVSVKATTHEGIGAIGRGEGIAAWAVASVEAP
jgi:2-C-methyl-D-erythritol 2,4-cyclodiphosphate synthase